MRHSMMKLSGVVMLALVLGMAGVGQGEEDAVAKQYAAVGAARAKAELGQQRARVAADENKSGWGSLWQTAETMRNKTYRLLEKAADMEQQKDEALRRQTYLDELHTKLDDLREAWDAYNAKEKMALNSNFHDAAEIAENLGRVLEGLAGAERSWKEAGADLKALEAAYECVAKRAEEATEQAQKALAAGKLQMKMWEGDLEAAKKMTEGKK